MSKKKLGLALGSGSFRGFLYLGVFRCLEKHNIKVSYLAGTSAGSMMGAAYAAHADLDAVEKFILQKKWQKVRMFSDIRLGGALVRGNNLEKVFDRYLRGAEFKDLRIKFAALATDINSGDAVVLRKGNVARAVRASSAIPFVFKPVAYKDSFLVDGAISNPVPDDVVREMGADVVLAVNVYDHIGDLRPGNRMSLAKVGYLNIRATLKNIARLTTNTADIVIKPDLDKFDKLKLSKRFFDEKVIRELVAIGEAETEKIIPKLERLLK